MIKQILKYKYLFLLPPLMLLYQNCGGPTHIEGEDIPFIASPDDNVINQGKTLYGTHCASCHGPIDSSSKKGRTLGQIQRAMQAYPQMAAVLSSVPPQQLSAISSALIYEANGGDTVVTDGQRLEFRCEAGSIGSTPLLKLTNREFRNAMNLLLDDFSPSLKSDSEYQQLSQNLPSDMAVDSHNHLKEQPFAITDLGTQRYFNMAFKAGELVAENSSGLNNYPGTNSCLSASNISADCHRSFVQQLASKAFRRPIGSDELNSLATRLWDNALSKTDLITLTFTTVVQDPAFLYKVYNRGLPTQDTHVLQLTNHELATRLSFLLTGAPPDAQLRAAADNNQLLNDTVLGQHVDRLLASSGANNMIARLFRESYGYDRYDGLSYNSGFLNGVNTSGLEQAMNNELDNFFQQVVLNQRGTFSDLFTSRHANISHAGLRSIYQIGTSGVVTLPASRSGFLNRAAMLTKRSGYQASPIKRGLKVLTSVFCTDVGEPPPSAPTSLPTVGDRVLTTRDTTEIISEDVNSSCVACHSRFNPLGYAFENYDTLGRERVQEQIYDGQGREIASLPVNTAATSTELGAESISFENSVELSNHIGQSDRAQLCFIKHLKEFEARVETTDANHCQMNLALNTLYGDDTSAGSIAAAIKALVMSAEFRHWTY